MPSKRAPVHEATITRDRYGVPHVHAATDAGAVFGFAYAQAEDNFWRIEESYLRALGRSAEVNGESMFRNDVMSRTLRVEELARRDYEALDARTRALADAFADGLDLYIAEHPGKARVLRDMQPWYPLALIRHLYYQNGFLNDVALRGAEQVVTRVAAYEAPVPRVADNQGSNGWVVAPSRTTTGRAMLFINPHLPFFGPGQVYEGHVSSDEGLNFTGYTRFGFPLPYVGHNPDIGWVSTDNAADLADVYVEHFDPADSLRYRYGTGWRTATADTADIQVRTSGGMETRRIRLRWTHHGPVVATRGGQTLVVRMAKYEEPLGWLSEWYAMTRARDTDELIAAMRPLDMLFGNVMSADRHGTIWYMYNGPIPRRDPRFDWRTALDGSDPATEWKGYHTLEELPQMRNPATGWMQNSNTTPWLLTSAGHNLDSTRYPRYMVTEDDNPRGVRGRAILDRTAKFSWEEWQRLAFDTRMATADSLVPMLLALADRERWTGDEKAAAELLRAWNRRADTASVATTVFVAWRDAEQQRQQRDLAAPSAGSRESMRSALAGLTTRFGTWRVAWGEVNRLQRRVEATGEAQSDTRPSIAVPGVNGADGAIFTFYGVPQGTKRGYGTAGASYVSVVEFGPRTRGRSVHVFGASADPASPHFFDQAGLYASGRMKPALLMHTDVRSGGVRRYRKTGGQ